MSNEALKRVAAINDISCLGKCSLTVALPVVSASGVECACIPTALLSTHTGGFTGYTFLDLADQILPVARHWKAEGFHFDGIFTGYMASPAQAALIGEVIGLLRASDTLVMVDPVMADDGRFYTGFDETMAGAFRGLMPQADIITPNVTEAAFLTGLPYRPGPLDPVYTEELLSRLAALCPGIVAVTGIRFQEEEVGCLALDTRSGERLMAARPAYPGAFHGSGDIFASAFGSLLVRGAGLYDALEASLSLVSDSIERTFRHGAPRHYGSDFEGALPAYIGQVNRLFS
jgi:pyridoxine kinase